MVQNFYELVWMFMIYAFLGWCMEVAYAALETGKFVNRGFMNGPYCPIYGFGVIIVVMVLTPLKRNLFLLFLGSLLLTSMLEFVTGFILEKIFHNQWWDYSDCPFNIKGYVCLKFSIYWGLGCVFIMELIHPMIDSFIKKIPFRPGSVMISLFAGIFAVDFWITVLTILKLNRHLKRMDQIAARIHNISDEIGENIFESVTDLMDRTQKFQMEHAELIEKVNERRSEFQEKKVFIAENLTGRTAESKKLYEEKKRQMEDLYKEYKKLFESRERGFIRLLKAFPGMKSRENGETLEKLKNMFKKDKE